MLLSTLYIMWPIHLQGFRLVRPVVKEKMHIQENTLFDLELGDNYMYIVFCSAPFDISGVLAFFGYEAIQSRRFMQK